MVRKEEKNKNQKVERKKFIFIYIYKHIYENKYNLVI